MTPTLPDELIIKVIEQSIEPYDIILDHRQTTYFSSPGRTVWWTSSSGLPNIKSLEYLRLVNKSFRQETWKAVKSRFTGHLLHNGDSIFQGFYAEYDAEIFKGHCLGWTKGLITEVTVRGGNVGWTGFLEILSATSAPLVKQITLGRTLYALNPDMYEEHPLTAELEAEILKDAEKGFKRNLREGLGIKDLEERNIALLIKTNCHFPGEEKLWAEYVAKISKPATGEAQIVVESQKVFAIKM